LAHLSDLLFQGHFIEKKFNPFFDGKAGVEVGFCFFIMLAAYYNQEQEAA
jgi:hypothetical protein